MTVPALSPSRVNTLSTAWPTDTAYSVPSGCTRSMPSSLLVQRATSSVVSAGRYRVFSRR